MASKLSSASKAEEEKRKKRQEELAQEEKNRETLGLGETPSSKSANEAARIAASKSGDATAIAAAQRAQPGSIPGGTQQVTVAEALQGQAELALPIQEAKPITGIPAAPDFNKTPIINEARESGVIKNQAMETTDVLNRIRSGEATTDEIISATGKFSLDAVDIEVLKAGEAQVSKTSQFVEGLPIIPAQIKKFILLFDTPSKKVSEIKDNVIKTKDNIKLWSDLAKANPGSASRYITLIKNAETQINRMESRIKLMTIQSPDLRANPEQIISLQSEISGALAEIQGKREELLLLGLR